VVSSITSAAGTARDASGASLPDAGNRCPPVFRSAGSVEFVPWTIAASRPLRGLGQQEIPDSRQNVRDVDLAIDQPECLKWLRTIPQVVTHDFSTKNRELRHACRC
jgi:hypothetical protein